MTPSRPMGSSSPSQVQFVFALPGAHGHLSFLIARATDFRPDTRGRRKSITNTASPAAVTLIVPPFVSVVVVVPLQSDPS